MVPGLCRVAGRQPHQPPSPQRPSRTPGPHGRHRLLHRRPLLPPPDLIPPARHIRARRRSLCNPIHDLRQIHRVVVQPRQRIRQRRIAIPAVLRPRPVLHLAVIRHTMSRSTRGLQKILHQVNRVIQKVRVIATHIEMNLALQLRPKSLPVPLQLRIQIVVLLPVLRGLMVNRARLLIEDRLRISILSPPANTPPAIYRTAPPTAHDRQAQPHTQCCLSSKSTYGPDNRASPVARSAS